MRCRLSELRNDAPRLAGGLDRGRVRADRHDVEHLAVGLQRAYEHVEFAFLRHLHRGEERERFHVGAVEKIERVQQQRRRDAERSRPHLGVPAVEAASRALRKYGMASHGAFIARYST